MSWAPGIDWNHGDYYHPLLLRQVPDGATRALDVACGAGGFARKLAERFETVEAIDVHGPTLDLARERSVAFPNITFREADLLATDLGTYDFISCITAIHHMPFEPALRKMHDALAPGGVLAISGMTKLSQSSALYAGLTVPLDVLFGIWFRLTRHPLNGANVDAPIKEPEMTGAQVKAAASHVLPGSRFRRRVFYRYSLVYRRPS